MTLLCSSFGRKSFENNNDDNNNNNDDHDDQNNNNNNNNNNGNLLTNPLGGSSLLSLYNKDNMVK